jgi:hypothetical protein
MCRIGNSDCSFINALSTRPEVYVIGLLAAVNSIETAKKLRQEFKQGSGGEE